MNLIIKNSLQVPVHTNIKLIFHALEERQKEFNWLISAHECFCWPSGEEIFDKEIDFLLAMN